MKIKIQVENFMSSTFEITEKEVARLCSNSIERVINQAIKELSTIKKISIAEEDLRELKRLMCLTWYAAQQAVFAAENQIPSPKG